MSSIQSLITHVKHLEGKVEGLQAANTPIEFVCYWGDEEIPDDGGPVFVTEWAGGMLDEDGEEDADPL